MPWNADLLIREIQAKYSCTRTGKKPFNPNSMLKSFNFVQIGERVSEFFSHKDSMKSPMARKLINAKNFK